MESSLETRVQEWSAIRSTLTELVEKSKDLTITGHVEGPQAGYKLVKSCRIELKNQRVAIDKQREALKANVLMVGRKIDGTAKELTAIIAPEETRLQSMESDYETEQARIKAEAEESKRKKAQDRVDALTAVGAVIDLMFVQTASEESFKSCLTAATAAFEEKKAADAERRRKEEAQAEADRKAKDEADRIEADKKAEADRMEAERKKAEQEDIDRQKSELAKAKEAADRILEEKRLADQAEVDKKWAALKAESDRQATEQKRMDEEKIKIEAERLRMKKEADEKAVADLAKAKEEEERIQAALREEAEKLRAAEEKAAAEAKAKKEAEEREEARPDIDKGLILLNRAFEAVNPDLSGISNLAVLEVLEFTFRNCQKTLNLSIVEFQKK